MNAIFNKYIMYARKKLIFLLRTQTIYIMIPELDEIKVLPLHDVFKKGEAGAFTPWLRDNISVLQSVIDIVITDVKTEVTLDSLRVDMIGTAGDDGEQRVIIENQFGDSNSEHLGKLLSYAAYEDSNYAIWICEHAKEEHIRAINMLNTMRDNSQYKCYFFLLEAKAIKIGNSKPAILFDIVAEPQGSYTTEQKITDTQERLYSFWLNFVDKFKKIEHSFKREGTKDHWFNIACGHANVHYHLFIRKGSFSVGLSFAGSDKEKNKENYRKIEEHQEEIEKSFGEPIVWSLMPDNKASKCGITCTELGGYEQEDFNPIIDKMIEIYQRFSSACKPFIDKL